MRVADVREIVEAAHVSPLYYSFDQDKHEALCLLAEGQTWKVFESERGKHYDEKSFPNEDAACTDFLKRIFRVWQPR